MIGYYTGLPMLDGFGLTDHMIAHKPISHRGRPGHEKTASPCTWSRATSTSRTSRPGRRRSPRRATHDRRRQVQPGALRPQAARPPAGQIRASPSSTSKITSSRSCGCRRRRRPSSRSHAMPGSPTCTTSARTRFAVARADGSAPARGRATVQRQDRRPAHRDRSRSAAPRVHAGRRSTSSRPSARGLRSSGRSFRTFPSPNARRRRSGRPDYRGAFADSFDPELGYAARGRLQSKPFELVGDVMELRVGGGVHSEQLRVSLLIDGVRVFSAAGCASEWHRPAAVADRAVQRQASGSRDRRRCAPGFGEPHHGRRSRAVGAENVSAPTPWCLERRSERTRERAWRDAASDHGLVPPRVAG